MTKPGSPYIGSKYRRTSPSTDLPQPKHGHIVGLTCPECSNDRSLVYIPAGADTVKVKCQTTPHYYRTFKLNQLNHEIALINAGHKYPIAYEPSAFGPPVNINGDVLPSVDEAKDARTPNPSKQTPPSMPCARIKEGPTSMKHKDKGHTGCKYLYCKSCCHEFGVPGECYPHRSTIPATMLAPQSSIPSCKRSRLLPEQCSQSVHRIGRIMSEDGELLLASARRKHKESKSKPSAPSIDEGKVVSLHLVSHPSTPVISHHFQHWPTVTLQDCPSLLREAQVVAGEDWNRSLLVWDEPVKNWREIGVDIPHKYTRSSRNLVLCVPTHRVALAKSLQDILERLGLGKPMLPRVRQIEANPVSPHEKDQKTTLKSTFPGIHKSGPEPICIFDSDSEMDSAQSQGEGPSVTHVSSTRDHIKHLNPALLGMVDEEFDTKPLLPESSTSNIDLPEALLEWPGEHALAADFLVWGKAMGIPYQIQPPTVYRYAAFIDEVGYYRMKVWYDQWPEEGETNKHNLKISQLRRHFQVEFNRVSSLKTTESRSDGLSISPKPRRPHSLNKCVSLTASRVHLISSEALGSKILPFDQPNNTNGHPEELSDLAYGLAQHEHAHSGSPQAVSSYKWKSQPVNVDVDESKALTRWDRRRTYPAVFHLPAKDINLHACALDLHEDSIGHHLAFAQMYAHADFLLQTFKDIVQIVQNVVLRKGNTADQLTRWFNLREPLQELPEFITSDDAFTPRHCANSFLGDLMACFTHWTYDYHDRQALISGFRGYKDVITDLHMMDTRRPWFLQNTYTGGLQRFASTHICNYICDDVGLVSPPPFYPAYTD
ncbi:hypothetical protein DFH28DRAFT_1084893 [Melampsora americana]|nr:hypothetical protein DFH28DRAFT_1084893 [Melampsora americana]